MEQIIVTFKEIISLNNMLNRQSYLLFLVLITNSALGNNPLDPIVFSKAEVVNEHTTRIPFKLIDHLIVVEAELLDQKGNFIIDTGSETLILNKVHFKTFEPYYRKSKETAGVINLVDNPLERQLKEFVIQNLKLTNKTSDVIDLSHIEKTKKMHLLGIIGFNILKDYEIFIDMHLNQITLSKVDSKGNTLDKNVYLETIVDSVDFKLKNHTIVLETYVDSYKLNFGLDTAAEYNQVNKRLNKKILKFFLPMRRLTLSGASGANIQVLAGKLHRVKLSETVFFAPMETVLSNLNYMNEAFGTSLDGILGYEFFKQKRTIINYQKEKLYFVDYPIQN
ncbi:MAG TPA: hypothetical protein VKZ98_09480 [Aquaticitalea sp.]|nr:hypothetical protein [Aquaticitalea sp.]